MSRKALAGSNPVPSAKKDFLIIMTSKYKTVISGSFNKHLHEIGNALENFKKAEVNVLAPLVTKVMDHAEDFVFLETDNPEKPADILENEFMSNIRKADFLYLANIGGYVGKSAATEIAIAIMSSIPVISAEKILYFSEEIPKKSQELLSTKIWCQLPINKISKNTIAVLDLSGFVSADLSETKTALLQYLVSKLLNDLKNVKLNNMSGLNLKQNPKLRDFQEYVARLVKERGFDKETAPEMFMLFLEECGEMAKAARKTQNMKIDKNSEQFHLDHEVADVFIYLLDICNHFNIDLEKAFRDKEKINKQRSWE